MTSLPLARNHLHDAIAALIEPTHCQGHELPSRYAQLRDAIADAHISGHFRSRPATVIPAQIDCLKLVIHIDDRTRHITGAPCLSVTGCLQHLSTRKWRPQDVELIETITAEISSWSKAIDDLFAPKPVTVYLPDPCPQCGHTHTRRKNDDGDTVRVQALAVTAAAGAVCNQCHARWKPEDLVFFGRVLGYHCAGVTA